MSCRRLRQCQVPVRSVLSVLARRRVRLSKHGGEGHVDRARIRALTLVSHRVRVVQGIYIIYS